MSCAQIALTLHKLGCPPRLSAPTLPCPVCATSPTHQPREESGIKEVWKRRGKSGAVAHAGWGDTLLDVSRLRLQSRGTGDVPRDGLDLDAAVVAFRGAGSGIQGMAMVPDTGAGGRAATPVGQPQLGIPLLRRELGHSPHRRDSTLRRIEALRRRVLSQGTGHGGHRARHRLAVYRHRGPGHFRVRVSHFRHFLCPHRHKARHGAEPILDHRLSGHRPVRHRRPGLFILSDTPTVHI